MPYPTAEPVLRCRHYLTSAAKVRLRQRIGRRDGSVTRHPATSPFERQRNSGGPANQTTNLKWTQLMESLTVIPVAG